MSSEDSEHSSNSCNSSSSDSDTDSVYVGDEEDLNEDFQAVETDCLLCNDIFSDTSGVFDHLKAAHQLDFSALRKAHAMDQISYIRFINYVRQCKASGQTADQQWIKRLVNVVPGEWEDDRYLQPYKEDDLMLTHWIEEDTESITREDESVELFNAHGISGGGEESKNDPIKSQNILDDAIVDLMAQVASMRSVMKRIITDEDALVQIPKLSSTPRHDSQYFESYDDVNIHDVMISDTARTDAYRLSILNNSKDFRGKTVLDVGCGSGILSMFAAQAGAQKVYAVDRSQIILKAREIVAKNGLQDKIECIQGKIEKVSIPLKSVDILISEWMGYFLLYEGMLESYLEARDKFLRPGGLMLPSTADLFLFGTCDAAYENHHKKWKNVHGFDFSPLEPKVISPVVEAIGSENLATDFASVLQLDLRECTYKEATFQSAFRLTVSKDCKITALCGYFDTGFTAGSQYCHNLTTSPLSATTHWFQTVFPLFEALPAKQGETVEGSISCGPGKDNPRTLSIHIELGNQKYDYVMV